MHALETIFGLMTIVAIAVILLQSFDRTTLQWRRQALDEIQSSKNVEYRIRCTRCEEKIIPLTDCPLCESKIRK